MPDVGFGTYGSGTRNTTDSPVYSDGIGLPGGRACSDGGVRAAISRLLAYADNYYSGGMPMQLILGGASTPGFTVGGGGATAGNTGYVGTNLWIVNGGSARFHIYFSGRVQFGGGGGGSGIFDGVGFSWTGTLAGAYSYVLPPTAPTISSVTSSADGNSATIAHSNAGDNGGSALTGARIQRATSAAFTTGLTTVNATGNSTVMTGLIPGQLYYYRATQRNAVTDTAGVLGGAWSGTFSRTQAQAAGLGRRWSGSAFNSTDGKRYNGSTWDLLEGREYSGLGWAETGT